MSWIKPEAHQGLRHHHPKDTVHNVNNWSSAYVEGFVCNEYTGPLTWCSKIRMCNNVYEVCFPYRNSIPQSILDYSSVNPSSAMLGVWPVVMKVGIC